MSRTTVTVPAEILSEAKSLGVNVSRVCQESLALEVRRLKNHRWAEENKAGIKAYNAFVEEHGVLTAHLRSF